MFTGIVQAVTVIKSALRTSDGLLLTLRTPSGWRLRPGDSVATDGVCLTIEKKTGRQYQCRLMPETLEKTTFGHQVPSRVNLEQSLAVGDKMHGHFVTGHIDCVGTIADVSSRGDSRVLKVSFPATCKKFCVPKGSICIDGVSLTVVAVGRDWCTVSLVTYTLNATTLASKGVGDKVNIEFDILAKYCQS